MLFSALSFGQETLFQDNFESGSSLWTLNGGTGGNTWIVNNVYTGATFPIAIPDTPNQPSGINGSPTSNYLHINSAIGAAFGALNANFLAGDNSNQDAVMTSSVSTTGKSGIDFSYWYLCAGQSGVSEGKVYYSTDNGASWTLLATHSGVSTWTQATYTLPAWDNLATLKFKFNWTDGASGIDPSFSVDDVLLTAQSSATATELNSFSISDNSAWCQGVGRNLTANFTASGNFQTGNVFSIELSDASGSFASPTVVGSLNSTATGSVTVPVSIPAAVAAGTNYRLRARSSDEAAVSSENDSPLVIYDLPTVTMTALSTTCLNHEAFALVVGSPAGGTYSGPGVSSNMFSPTMAGAGTWTISYSYVDANNCSNSASTPIVVDACLNVEMLSSDAISVYPNPASDKLFIEGPGVKSVVFYNLLGKEMLSFEKAQSSYDLSSLSKGTYIVKVLTDKAEKTIKVLVK